MLSIYSDRGWFLKTKMPNLVLQNAKIFMVFSLFNIIKALMPKFSQHNAKKDGVFKVQFHNKNLAFKMPKWVAKMPKWATKMLKLVTCCSIFVAIKIWRFQRFWRYTNKKMPALKL